VDPQPQVVKASGNTWAKVPARDPDTGAGRRVAFLPGNSPVANAEVGKLAAQFSIKPVDLGRKPRGWNVARVRRPAARSSLTLSVALYREAVELHSQRSETPLTVALAEPTAEQFAPRLLDGAIVINGRAGVLAPPR
jgi:hypothetical protein